MHWVNILGYLPTGACIFWTVFYCLAASKTNSFFVTVTLLICLGAYLVAPKTVLALLTGPSLIPLMMNYLDRIRLDEHPPFYKILWVVIPTALFTIGVIQLRLTPPDELVAHKAVLRSMYRVVLMVELGIFAAYLIIHTVRNKYRPWKKLFGFLFKHQSIPLVELQYCILLICTIFFLLIALPELDPYELAITPALFATGVFIFAYVALMGTRQRVTLKELGSLIRYNYGKKNKAESVEATITNLLPEADALSLIRIRDRIDDLLPSGTKEEFETSQASPALPSVQESWSKDPLLEGFQKEVINKKLFLKPSLSLQDVADVLGSNKTYVSKLVNNAYNLGFPELLNILRIDYAEQYLLIHQNAKQTELAEACGFVSASSFNSVFKKITGVTPKMWIASHR
ncbi:MAG: helix-turn-helix transcriptional regulator [Bacteroidales bacterium]|nr:helix-turn-helix transcriptional regulator [Bacteroidales bacterium]